MTNILRPSVLTLSPAWKGRVKHLTAFIIGVECAYVLLVLFAVPAITHTFTTWKVVIGLLLLAIAATSYRISQFRTPTDNSTFFYAERRRDNSILVSPLTKGRLEEHYVDGALLTLRPEMTVYFSLPEDLHGFAPGPHFQLRVTFKSQAIDQNSAWQFAEWINSFASKLFFQINQHPPFAPGEEVPGWEQHLLEIAESKSPDFTISDVKAIHHRPDLS